MTQVAPTVLDVSRAVAKLNDPAEHRHLTIDEIRHGVASSIVFQMERAGMSRRFFNLTDVQTALVTHGASAATVSQHDAAIAELIRSERAL